MEQVLWLKRHVSVARGTRGRDTKNCLHVNWEQGATFHGNLFFRGKQAEQNRKSSFYGKKSALVWILDRKLLLMKLFSMFIYSQRKSKEATYLLFKHMYHQSENKHKQTQHESRERTIRKNEVVCVWYKKSCILLVMVIKL